ncbi:hypothetical protein HaLaN_27232, partial [Haematococcus lacustris]
MVQSLAAFLTAGAASGQAAIVQAQAFCLFNLANLVPGETSEANATTSPPASSSAASSFAVRRNLLASLGFDFSSVASLTSLMTAAASAMTAAGSSALSSSAADPALVQAAVQAVSNLQAVLANSAGNSQALAQAIYLGQSQLLSSLSDLATGAISINDFAASTTAEALVVAAAATPVLQCEQDASAMVVSPCGLPDPRACGNDYNICVASPVATWDMLAFSVLIPDAPWSLPPALYSSGVNLTLVNYPVNMTRAGTYRLTLLAAPSVRVTLRLTSPASVSTFTASSSSLVLPLGGVVAVSINIAMPAAA